jgi:hypothetical protein
MRSVFAAKRAKFLEFEPFSLLFLVPGGRVIPALANGTLKGDDFSHSLFSGLPLQFVIARSGATWRSPDEVATPLQGSQ